MIRRICGDDPEALDLLDKTLQRADGRPPETFDNIQGLESAPTGTSAARAIRQLREQRPDLHARVMAKELSPHGAMVEAGFRRRMISLPEDPVAAGRIIRKHFNRDQIDQLIAQLR